MNFAYDELPKKEGKFHKYLTDSYGKVFTKEDSPTMPGTVRLSHPNDDWYYKTKTKKDKIVLHFTAGFLHADIGELTKQHVSVAYVVARDGTVYELFDPEYWSYHLGPKATGGNKKNSSSSIGIEICNNGPLTLENGILKTWSGSPYCTIDQADAFVKVKDEGGFRGHKYFASYTKEQFRTLDLLITNICRKHKILRKLPKLNERAQKFVNDPGEGIWSHQNFRSDKFDVGPAFEWDRISGR